MPSFGPIHKLIVHTVGDDDEPFHVNDFEDYEIEHPAECECDDGWYRCGVEHNVDNIGVRFSLRYSGTPVDQPGEYGITAWAETYRGFEYTEYDGGLAVCPLVTTEVVTSEEPQTRARTAQTAGPAIAKGELEPFET